MSYVDLRSHERFTLSGSTIDVSFFIKYKVNGLSSENFVFEETSLILQEINFLCFLFKSGELPLFGSGITVVACRGRGWATERDIRSGSHSAEILIGVTRAIFISYLLTFCIVRDIKFQGGNQYESLYSLHLNASAFWTR
ncbi:hypothetical protein AYI68_g5604 [Smittium mucronatum]|uniref:Uncharacterized protein n=1 Tax=Smittium mucronatum TaxID=133383 RepID=A0A1R0GTS4_9FUNG|nr:hypothetical protein AYI68_g5604 [Smittium mucronatum]